MAEKRMLWNYTRSYEAIIPSEICSFKAYQ